MRVLIWLESTDRVGVVAIVRVVDRSTVPIAGRGQTAGHRRTCFWDADTVHGVEKAKYHWHGSGK